MGGWLAAAITGLGAMGAAAISAVVTIGGRGQELRQLQEAQQLSDLIAVMRPDTPERDAVTRCRDEIVADYVVDRYVREDPGAPTRFFDRTTATMVYGTFAAGLLATLIVWAVATAAGHATGTYMWLTWAIIGGWVVVVAREALSDRKLRARRRRRMDEIRAALGLPSQWSIESTSPEPTGGRDHNSAHAANQPEDG